jgi:hypothetical protein
MAPNSVDDLVDIPKRIANKFYSVMDKVPDPGKWIHGKQDTSYQDDMVKKANESFAKDAANKKKVSGGNGKPTAAQRKPPAKKTIQRKRVAGK